MPKIERISQGHGLLEGPLYDADFGLVVADAEKGGLWMVHPHKPPRLLVRNRRGIGGLARHANGSFVVSGRNVALKSPDADGCSQRALVLLDNDPAKGTFGFNDLTTDSAGRVYVGSLAFHAMNVGASEPAVGKPTGKLYMIDIDGSVRDVAHGVVLSNGLGFSPDGKKLYHADSLRRRIEIFDVASDGTLHEPRLFASVHEGLPDGLAVDVAGNLWLALCHGGGVVAFSETGREIERLPIDVPMVTSLCFGGADWRDLYIVTGSTGAPPELGACVYKVRQPVPGLPRPLARVRFSSA